MINKKTKDYIEQKKTSGLYGIDLEIVEHPGLTLKDEIESLGISQLEFASKIGCTTQTISRIVNEREPISREMSVKLETVFGGRPSAEFWNNMQNSFDLNALRNKVAVDAAKDLPFFEKELKNIFTELKKYGFIENIKIQTKEQKVRAILELKKFFGVIDFSSATSEYNLQTAFRKYDRKNKDAYAIAGWVRTGILEGQKILLGSDMPTFNPKSLEDSIPRIKSFCRESSNIFLEKISKELKKHGVIIVYLPGFKNAHIGGALKWIKGRPFIILKTHKQSEDTFWFNLFHEIGHILKHSKNDVFMDFDDSSIDTKEQEADDFAQKALLPSLDTIRGSLEKNRSQNRSLETTLNEVAIENGVSVAVLSGRLCHEIYKNNPSSKVWTSLGKFRKVLELPKYSSSSIFVDF